MTPQSSFMVLAAIEPSREPELRQLLESMNLSPGRVDVNNPLIPFARFDALHFARILILDDQTTEDIRVYGLPAPAYPLYLAFLGDIDGEEDAFLRELFQQAGSGLRKLFSCCRGFTAATQLPDWFAEHRSPSIANYMNCRGRTVRQVREEAALRQALQTEIASHPLRYRSLRPRELHTRMREFAAGEQSTGRLTLSPTPPTPDAWWFGNAMHFASGVFLILLALPLLVVAAPVYLFFLRRAEKSDPEICPTVDQAHTDHLSSSEDHDVTNQFSAVGTLKPGFLRRLTTMGVLLTVDFAARHIVRPGRLGRIRTIHFARWVPLDDWKRMVFFSNYDGSVESYMDDFINKTGFGLNASFSNGIGYPRTNWLVLDGCADERKYKEFLRRHTVPTQVWYKAYPGLTAIDLERNTRVRQGLESTSMSDDESREWATLL